MWSWWAEIMSNKLCCRGCGAPLSPLSECSVCRENTSWVCTKCETMEDVTHTHYCFEVASSPSRPAE